MQDHEFELKLALPTEAIPKVHEFLISKGGNRRIHLQAYYIDTENFQLSKSGISLRVRKEGRYWIQTLKAPGISDFDRLEHNVKLTSWNPARPVIDWRLHEDHLAGEKLKSILAKSDLDLKVKFSTDVWRRTALIKVRNGLLEYALDEGCIKARYNNRTIQIPIAEIEIESKQGNYTPVVLHARQLVVKYGARLDSRTKAQRGYWAAHGEIYGPAIRGEDVSLGGSADSRILAGLFQSCLRQILGNASEINAGLEQYDEHLHQLRVGLRRLKTAMRIFELVDVYLTEAEIDTLAVTFAKLGMYRDANYLTEKLNPDLLAAQGPIVSFPEVRDQIHPSIFLNSKNFQLLLLGLLQRQLAYQVERNEEPKHLKKLVMQMLTKVHKSAKKKADRFNSIPEVERHDLRKKLKRFRYSLEFFCEFLDHKAYKNFSKELKIVLENLGNYNDICVAIERINESLQDNMPHWFALGWLKAEQKRVEHLCDQSLKRFFSMNRIW